VAELLLVL